MRWLLRVALISAMACGSVEGNDDAAPEYDAATAAIDANDTFDDSGAIDSATAACDPDGTDDYCAGTGNAMRCNPGGTAFDEEVCGPLGCGTNPDVHCRRLVPSLSALQPAWVCSAPGDFGPATAQLGFNTATGRITDLNTMADLRAPGEGADPATGIRFQLLNPPGSAPIGVFAMHSFSTTGGGVVRAGPNALAILTCGDLALNGVIEAAADGPSPGPGGSAGGTSGGPPTGNGGGIGGGTAGTPYAGGTDDGGGGGGGGYGGGGGRGGSGITAGGAGGTHFGSPALSPLYGGSGGGGGVSPAGAGGGAIYLGSSSRVLLSGTAGINVGGGGGSGNPSYYGGGGGGSGGSILIEAPIVSLASGAVLAANGGGGGGVAMMRGANGHLGTAPALGSNGGGAGGARGAPAGGDGSGTSGGGGGAGRIHINTSVGTVSTAGVILSPDQDDTDPGGEALFGTSTIQSD